MGALRNPRAACNPAKPAPTITICGALAKACSAIPDLLKNPVFLCFSFITAIVPCVRQQSQCFNAEDMQHVSCIKALALLPQIGRATSELQSPDHLVCRLLLEKKKKK